VISGDPCQDALSPEQITTLMGSPVQHNRSDTPNVGPGCSWFNAARGSQIDVGYDATTRSGLSSVYQNTRPQSAVWKPIADVGGFPAVAHAGSPGQAPPADFCSITLGLADDVAVDVSVSLGRDKVGTLEPCDAATEAAKQVAATLKSKAGS
jgi:hypothetical protein